MIAVVPIASWPGLARPSTPCGVGGGTRRGWWAFTHHDVDAPTIPIFCYRGAGAGWQVQVKTDSAFTKARIESIDDERVRADLDAGKVVVITGFQGVDDAGNITTLGRGGSDTSAVAIAAALKAVVERFEPAVDGRDGHEVAAACEPDERLDMPLLVGPTHQAEVAL